MARKKVSDNIIPDNTLDKDSIIAEQKKRILFLEEELQAGQEELEVSAEELESQLEELRLANEELNKEIIERKRIEEKKSFLAAIVESSEDAIISKTLDGIITSWNTGADKMFGYTADEIIGKSKSIIIPSDHPDELAFILNRVKRGELVLHYETVRLRKDGERIDVSISVSPIKDSSGNIIGASDIIRDITEHKRAEDMLSQQFVIHEAINRILQETITSDTEEDVGRMCLSMAERITQSKFGFLGEIGPDGTLDDVAISDPGWEACRMPGSPGHRSSPTGFKIHGIYGRVLLDGKPLFTNDLASHPDSIGTPKGHPPLRSFLGVPLFDRGKVMGMVAVGNREGGYSEKELKVLEALAQTMVEALRRKRMERALHESEQRFRDLADNIPNLAWMADEKGGIFWYNKQWYDYTGTTLDEMQGWGWQKIHHPDYVDAVTKEWSDSIAAGKPYDNIFPLKGKDGNYRWFLTRIRPIRDEKGNIVRWFGTNTDITERKQMEEDLKVANAQSELYLDLMGHDISNMHQIIMGQLELAQEILETDCKLDAVDKTLIDTSLETLDRSAKLIENVRNLQKLNHGEFREEIIDLDGLLSNVIREFDVIVPNESIRLVSEGLHYVKANKLLHDVFTNLIGNAIKHSKDEIDIAIILDNIKMNGKDYYRVSVEDNGPGISDDMKGKVFNRLQRGKTEARGVGLGLYLVKTLVESYGGFVKVDDRVRGDFTKGAKFTVYLPVIGGAQLDE